MERIKVALPDRFPFSTIIRVRITDLNYGGHVGNDAFLSIVHEARQQFLNFYGYSEMSFAGASLIMVDAAIEYKRELSYPDEVRVSVRVIGFDKIGFDIFYLLEVRSGDSWATAGKVKTGMLCYDYAAKKKVAVPEEAIEKLSAVAE